MFWSGLAGIWCGHLPQPSQCWTNIWSWFSDFENFVLLHWHHDGSLKPQRILTSFHMHSQYRAVGISWWGYRSAWLIASWRSAHLINFSCVRHKSRAAAPIALKFGVQTCMCLAPDWKGVGHGWMIFVWNMIPFIISLIITIETCRFHHALHRRI